MMKSSKKNYNLKFNIEKYFRVQRDSDYYIALGPDPILDNVTRVLVAPPYWISDNYLILPDHKARLLLRYEFFSNGKIHLKKEEFVTASDLPRFLH